MKRRAKGLSSILPADLAQLGILFGLVCLFITPQLRWCPWGADQTPLNFIDPSKFMVLGAYLIKFTACAGFFVCFRPGNYPARRLLWWVFFPALAGELVMIYGCYALRRPLQALLNFGPGCHYGLIGLFLVAVFVWRVSRGSVSLPLTLPESAVSTSDDSASWDRMQNFLSVFLALFPAVDWIYFPIMNSVGRFVYSHVHVFKNVAGVFAQLFVAGLLNILIAIWMTGKPAWYTLRRSLRLPETKGLALAVAFPIVISALISVGQFLLVLFLWSADKSGRLGPPHIGPYFTLPGTESLLLLFFALTEEIIFRGILQPRFIRRYGLLRGLFLVGVVFAAAHLNGDFSGSFTDGLVIFRLFVRLSGALPLSFVAGWLTLRSGSVFPAAVAHGLMNVLGNSPLGPTFWGIGLVMDLLWAILAYFLFRYWPVRAEPDERLCAAIATPAGFD